MRFLTADALAREYRRRGWESIAEYLEFSEEVLQDQVCMIYSAGTEIIAGATIKDPFGFFNTVLSDYDRSESIDAGAIIMLNACCYEYLFVHKHPRSIMLH